MIEIQMRVSDLLEAISIIVTIIGVLNKKSKVTVTGDNNIILLQSINLEK